MGSFEINSAELQKAISKISPIVKENSTLPILKDLLFDVNKDSLLITASNGEIRASVEISIEFSDKAFSFCIPKSTVVNILSGLPSVDLTMTIEKEECFLKSKIGVYSIPTTNSTEYPIKADLDGLKNFKVDTELFIDGLKKAVNFIDINTENIDRVLIKSSENKLSIAGIQNAYFYEKEFDYNGDDIKVVLTSNAIKYLIQTIDLDSDVSLNYNNTFFCVYFDKISIEVLQLAVVFPDYKKILDKSKSIKSNLFKCDRDILLGAIKRFLNISDKNNCGVSFDIKKSKLNIKYVNHFLKHTAEESIDVEFDGEDMSIGFDVNKLKTVLSSLDEDVEMHLSNGISPCIFYEENTTILLMPMKV